MTRLYPLLVLCALQFPAGAALAAPAGNWVKELTPAQTAQATGNFRVAYALYQRRAGANPLAQFALGMFHQHGWGRPADPVAACGWYEKAAQKRIPAAEHYWGDCLAQGIGRRADIPAALAWYEKAAAHGHLISACAAADYYIQGKGVAQDVARGIELCRQVAQANSPPAMITLARYYDRGEYLPRDPAAARYWYQEAAQRHNAEAQYRLGLMLAQGDGGEPDPAAALFWLETAASEGYAPAYLPTAELYASAPVQPDTGALAPEHLAKTYLWNAAARARTDDPAQRAAIDRIDALLAQAMPVAWRPDLDRQVAEHLARYPVPPAASPAANPTAAAR